MRLLVTGGRGVHRQRVRAHDAARSSRGLGDQCSTSSRMRATSATSTAVRDDERFRFVRGDICDAAMVRELAAEVDVIVNFAAESHVDRSLEAPGQFILTDVYGTSCSWTPRASRARAFLQVSTDEVYGEVASGLSVEGDPLRPRSPYSASKAGGELQVQAYRTLVRVPGDRDARLEHLRAIISIRRRSSRCSSPTRSTTGRCRYTATAAPCAITSTSRTTPAGSTARCARANPALDYNIGAGGETERCRPSPTPCSGCSASRARSRSSCATGLVTTAAMRSMRPGLQGSAGTPMCAFEAGMRNDCRAGSWSTRTGGGRSSRASSGSSTSAITSRLPRRTAGVVR